MLHYPLYREEGQTLMEGQIYFTEICLSKLGDIAGKRLLDVGCGNGIQTLYVYDNWKPAHVLGVDLSPMHVELAAAAAARPPRPGLSFVVDNAQTLTAAADESFDLLLCTESAHHYPDKGAFLAQVKRVLRPGGRFLIADLLIRDGTSPRRYDRCFSLFYWTLAQYREAFRSHGLQLEVEQELTGRLVDGFQSSQRWFDESRERAGPLHNIAKRAGRCLIALYIHELKNRFRYYLMAGVKT
jgi:ubiquinone/menaquinone biosynthesis C-methylase UbiE